MGAKRLLLDTVFVQALLNRRDQYHDQARALLPRVQAAAEVWVTEAVLLEVGNALSVINRLAAVQFIEQCYRLMDERRGRVIATTPCTLTSSTNDGMI